MANRRNDGWEDDIVVYSDYQTEAVADQCGIQVVAETETHWLAYCPFHGNSDTPALAIDKVLGLWNCFNPACAQAGKLEDLPRRLLGYTQFQSLRLVLKCETDAGPSFSDRLKEVMERPPEFVAFPQEVIDKCRAAFPDSVAESYMHSRGYDDDTLDFFEVGYSVGQGLVTVPMHDPRGMPVGFIGRTPSHTDKRFKNSNKLPKRLTAWNFHRAKLMGDTVIICEATFDAMAIHQAGYPNVVALLGGSMNDYYTAQLGRTFSRIVIFTDYDDRLIYHVNCRKCKHLSFGYRDVKCQGHRPGRELGRSIADKLHYKDVRWASYDDSVVFPNEKKDASAMTGNEIRQCITNSISHFEYEMWNPEKRRTS